MRWLILRLVAPLASFGGTAIDARRVTRDFPAASALTGLLANALGYDRTERDRLDRLQARLVFGARREHEPPLGRLRDYQTVRLSADDNGWTRSGAEGRGGGSSDSIHIRYRDYHADSRLLVVLHLEPADEAPTLDDLEAAIERPARPLFIGRKGCLPADYLLAADPLGRFVEAADARAALMGVPFRENLRATWPALGGEGIEVADRRNWRSGLHGGTRRVVEARITPEGGT